MRWDCASILASRSARASKEFSQFLFIAKSSAAELQSHAYVALDQAYISQSEFQTLYNEAEHECRMLSNLIKYLSEKGINTLEDIRRHGGIAHLSLPVEADHTAVRSLEAHANLSTVSSDIGMNTKVIKRGYTHPSAIAQVTRDIFVRDMHKQLGDFPSALLYEKSLKLWEGLSQEINFNVMLSQRGVYNLGHSLQDMRDIERRVGANHQNGIDAEVLTAEQIKAAIPIINISKNARYPVLGASFQQRGGVARHDAVAWGYARAADALGVDIIQQCEVTGPTGRPRLVPRTAGGFAADFGETREGFRSPFEGPRRGLI